MRVAPSGDGTLLGANSGHVVRGERWREVARAAHLRRRVLVVSVERRCHRRWELQIGEVRQRTRIVRNGNTVHRWVLLR